MKIWIDISNAPHVHFFRALIPELGKKGHEVVVTARDFGPICRLLEDLGIGYNCIGSHGGRDLEKKLLKNVERVRELAEFISRERPGLGLFKYSVEGSRVCFGLGIPSISVIDNEHAESQNRLIVPFSDLVISPNAIERGVWEKLGAREVKQFHGICELAHYSDFKPSGDVLKELEISRKENIIVARPEPFFASYCRRHSKLYRVLEGLRRESPESRIVYVPRNEEDSRIFRRIEGMIVPGKPIDSLSLYNFAGVMIGAGGSMNREACVAGCPAISLYPERLLAVDRLLIERGVMKHTLNEREAVSLALDVLNNGREWKARMGKATEGFENPHGLILRELGRVAGDKY